MAFRTGVAFPVGDATSAANDDLADRYAWQIPILIDLGAKVSDAVYVGAYFGIGFGAEGKDVTIESYCRDDDEDFENDIACTVVTLQAGIEGRYSFSPAEDWNPWVGYGIGFESAQQWIDDRNRGYRESTTASGLTVAKLSGGADYRGKVGIGPVGEVAIGRFASSRTEVNELETFSGDIDDPGVHAWLTVGLRMVINP
jgi:hypothetical protein